MTRRGSSSPKELIGSTEKPPEWKVLQWQLFHDGDTNSEAAAADTAQAPPSEKNETHPGTPFTCHDSPDVLEEAI